MKLYYKNNEWKIVAPNTNALLKNILENVTNKKFINLRQCSQILYSLTESVVTWNEDSYIKFIGQMKQEYSSFYMTKNTSSKGTSISINRNGINSIMNDFNYLHKLFSNILSSMILDRKIKLYFSEG